MSSADGMSGMAGGMSSGMPTWPAPTLALILALLLVGYTVHDLDRPAGPDGYFGAVDGRPVAATSALAAATVPRLLLSSAVAKACQVTTGLTMAFLLIIMI